MQFTIAKNIKIHQDKEYLMNNKLTHQEI